jgi:hypothetical protein
MSTRNSVMEVQKSHANSSQLFVKFVRTWYRIHPMGRRTLSSGKVSGTPVPKICIIMPFIPFRWYRRGGSESKGTPTHLEKLPEPRAMHTISPLSESLPGPWVQHPWRPACSGSSMSGLVRRRWRSWPSRPSSSTRRRPSSPCLRWWRPGGRRRGPRDAERGAP